MCHKLIAFAVRTSEGSPSSFEPIGPPHARQSRCIRTPLSSASIPSESFKQSIFRHSIHFCVAGQTCRTSGGFLWLDPVNRTSRRVHALLQTATRTAPDDGLQWRVKQLRQINYRLELDSPMARIASIRLIEAHALEAYTGP